MNDLEITLIITVFILATVRKYQTHCNEVERNEINDYNLRMMAAEMKRNRQ